MITKIRKKAEQVKPFTPAIFFFAGFLWDNLTLKRIDNPIDNGLLFLYLVALGSLILTFWLYQKNKIKTNWIKKLAPKIPLAIQFLLGSLLSAYVIFYFQSASGLSNFVFVILLGGLMVANEFLAKKYSNLYLQLILYFFAAFSFFIFFIPMVMKRLDYFSFWLGTLASVFFLTGLLWIFHKKQLFDSKWPLVICMGLVLGIGTLLHISYLKNWIPPVPLSIKQSGIYHGIEKKVDGFELKFEKPPWYLCWKTESDPFAYMEGDSVYCFSAIFAPTLFKENILHIWQWFNVNQEWETIDILSFEITGGRDHGFRGYTEKETMWPGLWRVEIRTMKQRLLGRVNFTVIPRVSSDINLESIHY